VAPISITVCTLYLASCQIFFMSLVVSLLFCAGAISLGLRTQKRRASARCTFKASDVSSAQKELHALDDALSASNPQKDRELGEQ